jgi:hypothetical protein
VSSTVDRDDKIMTGFGDTMSMDDFLAGDNHKEKEAKQKADDLALILGNDEIAGEDDEDIEEADKKNLVIQQKNNKLSKQVC